MCTVLAWNGTLPKGLLTNLLVEAESRGRDSTGIAFRLENKSQVYRQAISAREFTKHHQKCLSQARRATQGIAHTRRASSGMPINNNNAHPFIYEKIIFAHNGKIDNWRDVKSAWVSSDSVTASDKEYFNHVETDSQVLGPYLRDRNLSDLVGAMGLVWMLRDKVYCLRTKKELSSVTLSWSNSATNESGRVCLVGSTEVILRKAIADTKGVEVTVESAAELPEGICFEVTPEGLVPVAEVPCSGNNHEDAFSSGQ